jgi:hypothetical protein
MIKGWHYGDTGVPMAKRRSFPMGLIISEFNMEFSLDKYLLTCWKYHR